MSELQSATGSFQANFISRLSWGIKEFGGYPYLAFIFKMRFFFKVCFHFQNERGFVSIVFPFSEKHICQQKSVHSLQSRTDEVVNKQQNIYEAFIFVSVVKNLKFIISFSGKTFSIFDI